MSKAFQYFVYGAVIAASVLVGVNVHAKDNGNKGSIGGQLVLKDEGIFFVHGRTISSDFPAVPPTPGSFVVDQMYVQYRIPAQQNQKYPIVLCHGGGLTGSTYETTPDGREGWATYFARNGFAVYEVDFPGRGRAGFDPTTFNQAIVQNNISLVPAIRRTTNESAWTAFRFGPKNLVPYPGVQYPLDALDQFSAQGVPYTEVTLVGGSLGLWAPALATLLDKIGPAIVLVHSQSGPMADMLVGLRPQLVKATVNVEGNQNTIPTDAQILAYRNVPDLELFGDNVLGNSQSTGQSRYDGRKAVVTRINNAGGDAQIVRLPEIGLYGNTHMMMQDKNNLQVADYIMKWIDSKAK